MKGKREKKGKKKRKGKKEGPRFPTMKKFQCSIRTNWSACTQPHSRSPLYLQTPRFIMITIPFAWT
jgi:hypothetical protein